MARLAKRALELHRRNGGLVPPSIAQSLAGEPEDRPLFVVRCRGKNRFELVTTRRASLFSVELEAWIRRLQAAGRRPQQEKTIMACGGKGKGKGKGNDGPKMPKGGKGGKGKGK